MEQSRYLNNIHIYGNKRLLKGAIKPIKLLLNKIAKDHNLTISEIEVNLVDDNQLLKINQSSLHHDYFTDIITFDYNEGKEISGDIYISIDRIKENAKTYKNSAFDELLRVMCHGVLHLCGYKDKTKPDKAQMTKMENKYVEIYKK
jgi:probable rRNA maturation factor